MFNNKRQNEENSLMASFMLQMDYFSGNSCHSCKLIWFVITLAICQQALACSSGYCQTTFLGKGLEFDFSFLKKINFKKKPEELILKGVSRKYEVKLFLSDVPNKTLKMFISITMDIN